MSTQPPIRLAVLLSGAGTSLQNILNRIADGRLNAEVVAVISNNANAFGLERAQGAKIPAYVVHRKETGSLAEFSERMFTHCRQAHADLGCPAAVLHLIDLSDPFLR